MTSIRSLPVSTLAALQATAPAARPAPTAAASAVAAQAPTASVRTAAAPDLLAAEQRAIDTYFPPQPALALRLYGADRQAQAVSPDALGHRLDLRG